MAGLLAQRYQPVRALGEGAMGRVELVEDLIAGGQVALKVLAGPGPLGAEKSRLQLQQEFRLMARLRHPNCCAVYDYGVLDDGAPYFTMEVVPGQGLDELLPVPPDRVREVVAQLLLALGYVHQQGFVHGDVKPANVRVTPEGAVKLMDFGLMGLAGRPAAGIQGSPAYLPPEVPKGAALDGRADLYSVGALAYELLTGEVPFPRPTLLETLRAHVFEPPPSVAARRPGTPAELDGFVARLLAKEPAARFQAADEALAALGFEPAAGAGGALLAPPLLGREAALATLSDRLAAIGAGRPGGTVWLAGPAGVGKTRLLEELRCRAQLAEVPFVRGACHERRGVPYAPITAILRGLLPHLRREVPERLAAEAGVLAALLPELDAPAAPDLDTPQEEALRLQAAVTGTLRALAARRPFVMLVEDWRGADPASRDALAHLQRNRGDAPILLLASTRRGAEAAGGPADAEPLPLAGLAPADVGRMVACVLGAREVDPGFVAGVAERTGGNPYMVERLLDALVVGGALVRREGRWNTGDDLAAAIRAADPAGAAEARLAELSPEARAVADAAALHGHPASLELLRAMAALDDEPLFRAIEELARGQMLADDGAGAYAVARRDVAARLEAAIGAEERRRMHARAADALLALAGDRPPEAAGREDVTTLADHALGAGIAGDPRAWPWLLEAGRRQLSLFALAEAGRFLDAAWAAGAGLAPAARVACAIERANVLRVAGRYAEASALLLEARPLAEAAGDGKALGAILIVLARHAARDGRAEEAIGLLASAEATCREAGDAAGESRAALTGARLAYFRGEAEEATRLAAQATRAAAAASGGARALAQAYQFGGFLLTTRDPASRQVGLERLRRAIVLLRGCGDLIGVIDALMQVGDAELMLGRPARALEAYQEGADQARACGNREMQILAQANLAMAALEAGDLAGALGAGEAAIAGAVETADRVHEAFARMAVGTARARRGDAAGADAELAAALAYTREAGHVVLALHRTRAAMEAALARGDAAPAGALVDEAAAAAPKVREPELTIRLDACRARLAAGRGEAEAARALAEGALAAAREGGAAGPQAIALGALAHVALAAGDGATAGAHAAAMGELARAIGARYREAEALALQGEAALAGGPGDAGGHFRALATLAAAIGAGALRDQAAAGLARAAAAGPAAGAAPSLLSFFGGFGPG